MFCCHFASKGEICGARLAACLERLNARVQQSLAGCTDAGRCEVTALFAHTVGLLVLSHTGRIRMFKQASQDLFDTYLRQLLGRIQAAAGGTRG